MFKKNKYVNTCKYKYTGKSAEAEQKRIIEHVCLV